MGHRKIAGVLDAYSLEAQPRPPAEVKTAFAELVTRHTQARFGEDAPPPLYSYVRHDFYDFAFQFDEPTDLSVPQRIEAEPRKLNYLYGVAYKIHADWLEYFREGDLIPLPSENSEDG